MRTKLLATAIAMSFAMVACESSTSASSDTPVSSAGETTLSSSAGTLSSAGEADNGLSSSSSKVRNFDDDPPVGSSESNSGEKDVNSSASTPVESAVLTSEQMMMLKALEEKLGDADPSFEIEKSCQTGAVKTVTVLEQEVTFTCIDEDWIPTSGLDKVYALIPDEVLQPELDKLGITRDELMVFIDLLSKLDPSKNSLDVLCEGEPDGDYWELAGTGIFNGLETAIRENLTFDGSGFTVNRRMSMEIGSVSGCNTMLALAEGDEEFDDDADIYGTIVRSKYRCDGGALVYEEQTRRENVTQTDRAEVYADMIGKCKAYLAGEITFEEMMSE
ncbi:hypothetical protein [uncultured Fibrobacter sp.]|uniref:hypothetical protein n=1 Tax=uncultured Fibrobacter sp. TaxID=261512 RepID=UPI0026186171|nr:hypothetical protein [uncultured Fibrobacter sp.]